MSPELLALLTEEEFEAWEECEARPGHLTRALTTIATLRANIKAGRAAIRDEVSAMRVTLDEVQVLAIDLGRDSEVLRDHLRKRDAEIAELRATLANEHGEGPPIDGWRRNTTNDGVWERVLAMRPSWTSEDEGEPTDTLIVGRDDDVHWRWERYTDSGAGQRLVGGVGGIECARTAMRAADAAVKGAT